MTDFNDELSRDEQRQLRDHLTAVEIREAWFTSDDPPIYLNIDNLTLYNEGTFETIPIKIISKKFRTNDGIVMLAAEMAGRIRSGVNSDKFIDVYLRNTTDWFLDAKRLSLFNVATKDTININILAKQYQISSSLIIRIMDFYGALKHGGIVASFNETSNNVINLLEKPTFLKLYPYMNCNKDNIKFINLILESICGGDINAMNNVEQVIRWKYLHPEVYTLPALCFSGEGGTGKNLFFESIIRIIFGHDKTLVQDAETALKRFNYDQLGMVAVLIDEGEMSKREQSKLRTIIGNKTINIEQKYGTQIQADNTLLYMLTSNSKKGAITLRGDHSDRRYSIILTPPGKTLHYHIAKQYNLKWDENWIDSKSTDKESPEYIAIQNKLVELINTQLTTKHIQQWLSYIHVKWYGCNNIPIALHGKNYEELLDRQTRTVDHDEALQSIFEIINTMQDWGNIDIPELWQTYKDEVKLMKGGILGRNRFYTMLDEHIRVNNIPLEKVVEQKWNGSRLIRRVYYRKINFN